MWWKMSRSSAEEAATLVSAFDELISGMAEGRGWSLMGEGDAVRELLDRVYDERCHGARHHKAAYQLRVNLQKKEDLTCPPKTGPAEG